MLIGVVLVVKDINVIFRKKWNYFDSSQFKRNFSHPEKSIFLIFKEAL